MRKKRHSAQSGTTNSLLSYVPADAVFAAIARPRFILTHESMKMLPIEVISAAGKKELGIDPLDIESALIVAEPPVAGPPELGVVLQMSDKSATLTMEPAPPYLFAEGGIIIAASTEAFGEKIKASRQAKMAPLADTLQRATKLDFAATLDLAQLRPLLQAAIAQAPPLPPPLEPLKQTPELVSRIELDVRARPRILPPPSRSSRTTMPMRIGWKRWLPRRSWQVARCFCSSWMPR